MDSLPIELLDIIASESSGAYYGLLGYKFFTDTLTYSKRVDMMILFGYSVKITALEITWLLNEEIHRMDGPAWEHIKGIKRWYINGDLHRDNDLPAHEELDVRKEWYQNGERHRDNDLPAFEHFDGYKAWYRHGQRHRDNGPAIIWDTGFKEWFRNGLRYAGITTNTI